MRTCTSEIWRGSRVKSGSTSYGRSATTTKSTHDPGTSTRGSSSTSSLTCATTIPSEGVGLDDCRGVLGVRTCIQVRTPRTPRQSSRPPPSDGIVVAQVNELVEELPRVDVPGSWVDFVVVADRPYEVEPLFARDVSARGRSATNRRCRRRQRLGG